MRNYKGHYFLAFYSADGETPVIQFENIIGIVKYLKIPETQKNIKNIQSIIYTAIREKTITRILGKPMRVFAYYTEDKIMVKMVHISSPINITVTAGLQFADNTDVTKTVADKKSVAPVFPRANVDIKAGKFSYPEIVKEYPTVKSLEKKGVFTIGNVFESDLSEDVEFCERVWRGIKQMENAQTGEVCEEVDASKKKKIGKVEKNLSELIGE